MDGKAVKVEPVSGEEALVVFADLYARASGLTIPMDYLRRSRVVRVVDGAGRVRGGFALGPGAVMRWPRQVPPDASLSRPIDLAHSAELNALWLDPAQRKGPGAAAFWLAVGKEIGASPYRHITFCVDPRKQGLARLYQRAASGILYEGPVVDCPLPQLRIFHSTPRRFRWLWLLYAPGLLRRFLNLLGAPRRGEQSS